MPVHYDNIRIGTRLVDPLVKDKIGVELKAVIRLKMYTWRSQSITLEAYNLEI